MLERVRSAVRWVTEDRRRFVVAAVATAGLGLVPVLALPTNSDVAWLLYAAERVLEGDTLYVDLIEVNPPLVVWLSLPPVAVARELGVASRAAFIRYVAAVAALSLVVAGRTLPRELRLAASLMAGVGMPSSRTSSLSGWPWKPGSG